MSGYKPTAVVLLSGGIDSATTLAIAKRDRFYACAITFDYGQRHAAELKAAERVAQQIGVEKHLVMSLDLRKIGGSALTDDIPVPKDSDHQRTGIPVTYVPARNTIFLSIALGYAETVGASDIFIGANAIDYSGYPDCRPEYIEAFQKLANLATRTGVQNGNIRIHAPLLAKTKADIIRLGYDLGVDFSLTLSCYDPSATARACGRCDSCRIRSRGFKMAGIEDATKYIVNKGARV